MAYPFADRLVNVGMPAVQAALLSDDNPAVYRNLLHGGDFTINPMQRNIAGLATTNALTTAIASTTPTYFADRWFGVGSATCSLNFTWVADTTVAGFGNSIQFGRTSTDTHTATLYMGQVLETADSIRCQGLPVVFSFWAKTGALYSGGALTVQIIAGTGTNDTAANMNTAAWTTQANVVSQAITLTGTMTRYQIAGTVPVATTQLGVQLSWKPTGTAGATDYIQLNGLQLELGTKASNFEHRSAQAEWDLCTRYAFMVPEPASTVIMGMGMITGSAVQQIIFPLPQAMVKAPTATFAAGGIKINLAGSATTPTTLAAGTCTPSLGVVTTANTGQTAGQAVFLQGTSVASAGYILFSADF